MWSFRHYPLCNIKCVKVHLRHMSARVYGYEIRSLRRSSYMCIISVYKPDLKFQFYCVAFHVCNCNQYIYIDL